MEKQLNANDIFSVLEDKNQADILYKKEINKIEDRLIYAVGKEKEYLKMEKETLDSLHLEMDKLYNDIQNSLQESVGINFEGLKKMVEMEKSLMPLFSYLSLLVQ